MMRNTKIKWNSIGIRHVFLNTWLTFLRSSQIKTLVLAITISTHSYAQNQCIDLFSQQGQNQKTQITDLNSFGKAMTEGMLLNPEQTDIFEVYRKVFFGDPNTSVDGHTLKSVTDILKKHPELQKPMFTEFAISTVEKIYSTPETLAQFIKSQITTAGQIRSNLFQIEANLGFWKKLLDYKDPIIPESLQQMQKKIGKDSSEQDKQAFRKAKAEFESLALAAQAKFKFKLLRELNRIISPDNRKLLADLRNENTTYYNKTKALFKTLQYLESWMLKQGRNTQAIRQAMYDLVFTVGYGNLATIELLKSTNGLDKIRGLQQLWAEADGIAEELGFAGHMAELKQKLQIQYATGFTKNDDFVSLIQSFEKDVLSLNYTTKPTDSIRVRSLSIQESPFRSCLGKDCSTRTYFDKALDPNYVYFTMTDSNHHSDGHATLVLGTATNPQTGEIQKVAFLDKLQNIPTQQIEVFLNAVDQSLQTQGYRLAIPTYLGKDIPGHGGLSNMDIITDFVQSNIMPRLNQALTQFTPNPHQYQFKNKYSRGDQKLEVRIFNAKPLDQNTEISRGQNSQPYIADASLNKEQLSQQVLKLKDSDNPDDIIKFISLSDGLIKLGLYSKDQVTRDLENISNDLSKPAKIRKQAFYSLLSESSVPYLFIAINAHLEKLSDHELNQAVNEMISFKKSSNPKLKKIGEAMELRNFLFSRRIMSALIKNGVDVNAKDINGRTVLYRAVRDDYRDVLEYLIKQPGVDLNAKDSNNHNVLHFAAFNKYKGAFEFLLKQPGIDLNAKDDHGNTVLLWAAAFGYKEAFEYIMKQPGVDLNAKDSDGGTALHVAAKNTQKELLEFLIKQPGVDLNEKDRYGNTVLHLAAIHRQKEVLEILIKQPGVDFNAKDVRGKTALDYARENGWL